MNNRILRDPVGGDGGVTTHALDVNIFPEDIRKDPSLSNIKTIEDLGKGYVNAQKLIGAKRIAIPGENAADAEWASFYEQIGRPKTASDYQVPEVKVDESLKVDPKRMDAAKDLFHKLGLSGKQAKGIMEYYMTSMNDQVTGTKTQREQEALNSVTELRTEWGQKYEAEVDVANSVLKKFGDKDGKLQSYLEGSGMGNNVELIRLLNRIGKSVMEDKGRGNAGGLEIGDEAKAIQEIENMKIDPEFQKALGSPSHPGHRAAVQRWSNVFAAAYPGAEPA